MSTANSGSVVGIVDIGSNSIKSLVATRDADGRVQPVHTRTIDARISAGISRAQPRLSEAGMTAGLEAIRSLVTEAEQLNSATIILVATSAVRDAENGAEFRARVRAATGQTVRILSGDEEANLIGRGLTCDPALHGLSDFYVFDLGGGSLECLAFRNRQIEQAISLQLGCVRLTEKFVAHPEEPLPRAAIEAIQAHTRSEFERARFRFSLPVAAVAVGTGGTVATVRTVLARDERPLEMTNPLVSVRQLSELLEQLGAMPLVARREVPGLPPARADVFPTALATLLSVAELGGFTEFRNSIYNLRYGLADEALPA